MGFELFILLNFLPQALALLSEYVGREDACIRIGAIMGLGISYAGTQNDQASHLAFCF